MAKRQPAVEALKKGDMKYDDDKEYGEDGKEAQGGGYRMAKGKLYKMDMDKSDLSEDELQKSLDQLEGFADLSDHESRKDALMQKSLDSGLGAEENEELMDLLAGNTADEDEPESITKSFDENPTLQKAMEVSSFLTAQHEELTKALDIVSDRLDASDTRQHNFNLVLAKSVALTGRLVQELSKSVEVMGGQPARGPKSRGAPGQPSVQPLAKSFAGTDGEKLSKAEMMGGLEGLFEDVIEKSGDSKLPNGVDLLEEISKFEQSSMMDPKVAQMVQRRIATQRGAN